MLVVSTSWECSASIFFVCRTGIIVSAYHIRAVVMVIEVWSALIIKKKNGGGEKAVFLMS